ncbi:MAG TPA: sodium:solute symporter [Thermoleophilaceae bacterium]|nr:sodium:solute symporter [Thermoleophilaceae bacterium]
MTVEHETKTATIVVFLALFLLVTVLGFVAARWRRGDLKILNEWGLGGKRFGTVVTWFLLGGDIYTAYTFIAVPALMFGVGAAGFFALPYTIIVYPLAFLFMGRLWSVAARKGYVTPADFVRGRYGSHGLALSVAFTGLLATMPYIALQLIGLQVVIEAMGVEGDWPIIVAFLILALYTYNSGLRAPALISLVKDLSIYITVIVAVIYIPSKLGGYGEIFDAAGQALPDKESPTGTPGSLIPEGASAHTAYATLAFGSALALFMYPHVITGVLSSKSQDVVRRNMAILPAYTLMLGLLALLGYMAIAAGLQIDDPNFAVPDLMIHYFPDWFEGFAFAAIGIGALVPAAVMSIAAANLFTRNIYKEYLRKDASDQEEAQTARITSLVVKVGALAFVLFLPNDYAIDLQLLGGVWICQTLPALVIGLFTRWFDRRALLLGWFVGMVFGTIVAASQEFAPTWEFLGITAYTAIWALALNFLISGALTLALRSSGAGDTADETRPEDYDELTEAGQPAPVAAKTG